MPRQPVVYSWWAQRWVDLLESLDYEWQGRLSRGRSLARNNSVQRLQVRPGTVSAQVSGHYWDHYQVRLELPPFPGPVWASILQSLAGEASYVAKLLARELPPELEEICARAGGQLFPKELGEVRASCTCPDPSAPCKHILAAHYAFATEMDRDPSLLLQLRGRSREEITAALRERWANEADGLTADSEPQPVESGSAALRPERFYEAGPELDAFAASFVVTDAPPPTDAAVLARLGRPPFANPNEEPQTILAPIYHLISERALQAARRGAKKTASRKRRGTGEESAADAAEGDAART
jgi:uncharacterized Zn finger protein